MGRPLGPLFSIAVEAGYARSCEVMPPQNATTPHHQPCRVSAGKVSGLGAGKDGIPLAVEAAVPADGEARADAPYARAIS